MSNVRDVNALTNGDLALGAAVGVGGLGLSMVGLWVNRRTLEEPVPPPVSWRVARVRGAQSLCWLTNTGTDRALSVTADWRKAGPGLGDLPSEVAIGPGSSWQFLLRPAARHPSVIWLTWEGQREPVAVPMP